MINYKIKDFDGPLDLLLTLIGKAKIDIKDIFVSEITEQYLKYMDDLGDLDMDSASEFLEMAARLLEIKSRALLPKPPEPEDPEEETPEQALIRQLTEYKAFKDATEDMKKLETDAKELITKLPQEYPLPPKVFELTGLTLEKLTRAFSDVLDRLERRDEIDRFARREIKKDEYTVGRCMNRIMRKVKQGRVFFDELFTQASTRSEVVTVFLALLELLKANKIKVYQKSSYERITISEGDEANNPDMPEVLN